MPPVLPLLPLLTSAANYPTTASLAHLLPACIDVYGSEHIMSQPALRHCICRLLRVNKGWGGSELSMYGEGKLRNGLQCVVRGGEAQHRIVESPVIVYRLAVLVRISKVRSSIGPGQPKIICEPALGGWARVFTHFHPRGGNRPTLALRAARTQAQEAAGGTQQQAAARTLRAMRSADSQWAADVRSRAAAFDPESVHPTNAAAGAAEREAAYDAWLVAEDAAMGMAAATEPTILLASHRRIVGQGLNAPLHRPDHGHRTPAVWRDNNSPAVGAVPGLLNPDEPSARPVQDRPPAAKPWFNQRRYHHGGTVAFANDTIDTVLRFDGWCAEEPCARRLLPCARRLLPCARRLLPCARRLLP